MKEAHYKSQNETENNTLLGKYRFLQENWKKCETSYKVEMPKFRIREKL